MGVEALRHSLGKLGNAGVSEASASGRPLRSLNSTACFCLCGSEILLGLEQIPGYMVKRLA